MPDDKPVEQEEKFEVSVDDELRSNTALSNDGNDKPAPTQDNRPAQGDSLESKGLLPGASVNLEIAPGIELGDRVSHAGEQWTAKGVFNGKGILHQEGRGAGFQGEFRIMDGKPDPADFKELPRFDGQAKDTTYYADKNGEVFKLSKAENGKFLMSSAQDVKLAEIKDISPAPATRFVSADLGADNAAEDDKADDKASDDKPADQPAAKDAEAKPEPKVGDEIEVKGEKLRVASFVENGGETSALLYKQGAAASDAVAGTPISSQDLASKYDAVKVQIDGKEQTRYIEKGHPEKGVYQVMDLAGEKTIYQDTNFKVLPKTELVKPADAPATGDGAAKPFDPAKELDLERIKKIAEAFSEKTREVPLTREQFKEIFKGLSEADMKIALEIMERSAPNITPRALDDQMRSLQNQLDKLAPEMRKNGVTVFVLKGDDSGAMMAQLLRKNQDQLKVNVVELDAAGLKEMQAKGVPESALVLGDMSKANAAQREVLSAVKKLYVSDVNGFDRGLNLIDYGASQFSGPEAMREKLAGLVDQAKALQAKDATLTTEEAVRRVMQGDTAKAAAEINPNAKVIQPDAPMQGRELRNQVGGNAEYRVNSMYEQLTAPQLTPKQVEQYLSSIANKEKRALTAHIMENGGVQYTSYTNMMKEYRELHQRMMSQLPPGTKPADVILISGLEQHGMLGAGKNIDNVGSQLVAAKLYAAANGLGPENFMTAKELAARGPGAANGKVIMYVDDFSLSGRQAAGVMNQNAEMLKASGGKIVVATIGKFETKTDAWNLWQTDPKRYGNLKGLDVTVMSNHTYKNFYDAQNLEKLGLKGRETELGRFNWFKPKHDSGVATYLLTPYGGPNNNMEMLEELQSKTGLRGSKDFKNGYDLVDAMQKAVDAAKPPQPVAQGPKPERVVPKPEGITGTNTTVNPDGSLDRQETKPGEVLAKKQLEERQRVDAKEIETMRKTAEELAKSDKAEDKEKAEVMRKTVDALEGKYGKEAMEVAHREMLAESRKALERGEGGGYGKAVVGGLIGVGILATAALAYYRSTLKAEEQRQLERARVR